MTDERKDRESDADFVERMLRDLQQWPHVTRGNRERLIALARRGAAPHPQDDTILIDGTPFSRRWLAEQADRRGADARASEPTHWIYRVGNSWGSELPWALCKDKEEMKVISGMAHSEILPLYAAPQPAADAWRTMESAPKDGTHFLAVDYDKPKVVREIHWFWETLSHSEGSWRTMLGIPFRAIKWRPLPAPPGSSPTSAADAVAIVERLRKKWEQTLRSKQNPSTEAWTILTELQAADKILAALRSEAS